MGPLPFAQGFHYRNDVLYCGTVPVSNIVDACGTPLYLYNLDAVADSYAIYEAAFSALDHLTCYAVKANSSLALLKTIVDAGAGLDVNSRGELLRALRAGADSSRITMTGVGKSRQDIAAGIEAGILLFNAESAEECVRIDEIAHAHGSIATVVFRINPDIDAHTHPYIATGLAEHKFGLSIDDADAVIDDVAALHHIRLAGFGMHLGSMLFDSEPYVKGIRALSAFIDRIRPRLQHDVTFINIGGGIGVPYRDDAVPFSPRTLVDSIRKEVPPQLRVLSEPGRFLVANAGILLASVEYIKHSNDRTFLILDAGMNDLIRPALYEAHHEIHPTRLHPKRKAVLYDVVGPVCESGDTFAVHRTIQEMRQDERIAIFSAGAYGATMGSSYNSRQLPAEVVVSNGIWRVSRERQSFEQMLENERLPQE